MVGDTGNDYIFCNKGYFINVGGYFRCVKPGIYSIKMMAGRNNKGTITYYLYKRNTSLASGTISSGSSYVTTVDNVSLNFGDYIRMNIKSNYSTSGHYNLPYARGGFVITPYSGD